MVGWGIPSRGSSRTADRRRPENDVRSGARLHCCRRLQRLRDGRPPPLFLFVRRQRSPDLFNIGGPGQRSAEEAQRALCFDPLDDKEGKNSEQQGSKVALPTIPAPCWAARRPLSLQRYRSPNQAFEVINRGSVRHRDPKHEPDRPAGGHAEGSFPVDHSRDPAELAFRQIPMFGSVRQCHQTAPYNRRRDYNRTWIL